MGEYVWTDITIGGKVSAEIAEELISYLDGEFGESKAEVVGLHLYAGGQRNYGNADEVEEYCREHGLSYVLMWSAAGGVFDAGSHAWRPGMEHAAEFTATDDGEPTVSLAALKRDLAAGVTLAEIIAGLDVGDASTLPAYEVVGSVADASSDSADAAPNALLTPLAGDLTAFLCIGMYDDGSRFADTVEAANAEAAEEAAKMNWPAIELWAGFVALRDGVMTVEG